MRYGSRPSVSLVFCYKKHFNKYPQDFCLGIQISADKQQQAVYASAREDKRHRRKFNSRADIDSSGFFLVVLLS